jgi:threonine dehydratase
MTTTARPLPVTAADVERAAERIRGAVVETPTTISRTLSEITGAEVWLKFENLQFTASFKERGACNFLLQLSPDERARGVVAASAGNHAQGVAYHARRLGIAATIVMPRATPFAKVSGTERLGARIVLEGDGFEEALAVAQRITAETGAKLVPPFDDPRIIAGQGTVALEMLDAAPDLDVLVVPVGGGGLISGMAIAAKDRRPGIDVVGVQSETYPSMAAALGTHAPPAGGPTVAEGIAVVEAADLTTDIVRALVDDVLVVPEDALEQAVALALEIEKVVVEGAGVAGLAAVLTNPARFHGRKVGLVLTGGNIDLRVLSSVILRALARSGRLVRLRIEVADRPGVLAAVAHVMADHGANIVDVEHRRDLPGVALKSTLLEVAVETRDAAHSDELVRALERHGFAVTRA